MARMAKSSAGTQNKKPKKWSAAVTQNSDALDLEEGVFTQRSAQKIAASLKRSAELSRRRKGTAFQSAMSMLNFHMNRAGKNLTAVQRERLDRAKDELRRLFGRTGPASSASPSRKPKASSG